MRELETERELQNLRHHEGVESLSSINAGDCFEKSAPARLSPKSKTGLFGGSIGRSIS